MKIIIAFFALIFISIWSAVEIGSGNIELGLGVLALSLFAIIVVILGRKMPFDLVAMIACVGGYIVLGKGFAYLKAGSVFFVGEMLLALLGLYYLSRVYLRQITFIPNTKIGFVMFVLILVGGIRVMWDYKTYGLMAIRDYCIIYYCFVFFCAYELFRNNDKFRAIAYKKLVPFYFLGFLAVIIDYFIPALRDILYKIRIGGNIIFIPHEATAYAAVALGMYLFFLNKKGLVGILYNLLGCVAFAVVLSTARGAIVLALMILFVLLLLAKQWRKVIPLAVLGVIGFSSLMIYSDISGKKFKVVDKLVEEVSTWNVLSSTADRMTTAGWRWFWWKKIVRDVTAENPLFGLGFGRDIGQEFRDEYYGIKEGAARGDRTRGAHSALFTILARVGYTGAILFLIVIWHQLRYFWKAIRLMRVNQIDANMAGALGFLTMGFVVTFVQYTWDASYSAIPFWFVCGLLYTELDEKLPDGAGIQYTAEEQVRSLGHHQLAQRRSQSFAH